MYGFFKFLPRHDLNLLWFPCFSTLKLVKCGHNIWSTSVVFKVADPHHFNADPDPDPAFNFNADPDPAYADPDPDPAPHQSDGNLRPLV